jgi:hypothetical protein
MTGKQRTFVYAGLSVDTGYLDRSSRAANPITGLKILLADRLWHGNFFPYLYMNFLYYMNPISTKEGEFLRNGFHGALYGRLYIYQRSGSNSLIFRMFCYSVMPQKGSITRYFHLPDGRGLVM